MSDIRFKIDGNARPFLAQARVQGSSIIVASRWFEYSGVETLDRCNHTCAILSGLQQNTIYEVTLTDSIGNVETFLTEATPPNPIVIPTELDVSLDGTISSTVPGVKTLSSPKTLSLSPALSTSQSIDVVLCGKSTFTDGDDSSEITVYCRPNGGSYSSVMSLNNQNDSVTIRLEDGDSVCYDMQSVVKQVGVGTSCTDTCLSLESVTPVAGFGTCYNITCGNTLHNLSQSCTVTTTCTTDPPPPPPKFMNVTPTAVCHVTVGDNTTVNVCASEGVSWCATDNRSWIFVTSSTGTGDGSFGIQTRPNPDPPERFGSVTVSSTIDGSTCSVNVSVNQAGF